MDLQHYSISHFFQGIKPNATNPMMKTQPPSPCVLLKWWNQHSVWGAGASGDLLFGFAQKYTEWGGGVEPFTLKFLWIFLLLMYFASCVFLWTASLFEYCKLNPEQLRIIGYDPSVKLTEGLSLC